MPRSMKGKNILELHKTYGMFSRGIKGGESKGYRWFGEKQAWENREIRAKKGQPCAGSLLVGTLHWPHLAPDQQCVFWSS